MGNVPAFSVGYGASGVPWLSLCRGSVFGVRWGLVRAQAETCFACYKRIGMTT